MVQTPTDPGMIAALFVPLRLTLPSRETLYALPRNSARSVWNPGFNTHDLSVFKNFPFGGNKKFQYRLSAYNVFNHPQRTFDDPTNLTLNFANGVQTNQNFGVLPQDNKYGHRILQMAFKFYF